VTAENGRKLLVTVAFFAAIWLINFALRRVTLGVRSSAGKRIAFWVHQAIQLTTAIVAIVAFLSIWFNDPGRLSTFLGLVAAGVAFAMQKVVTAIAAYFVLLRGKTFNVGERIKMGGVRGDVIDLGFIQTTIMEMGQPPAEQSEDPGMWVHSRQYSGRIVTVTNDKIFEEPVYNYSREFPFIWEEMHFGIPYNADHGAAERILLDAARKLTKPIIEASEAALHQLERRYSVRQQDLEPRVFWRMTDNWLEMSLRFISHPDGVRDLKDKLTRSILSGLERAGIQIASGTYEIVGMPKLDVHLSSPPPERDTNVDRHLLALD
jgi:small-conductance mechanosensitive channel